MAYINDRTSGFLGWMAARAIAGQRMAQKAEPNPDEQWELLFQGEVTTGTEPNARGYTCSLKSLPFIKKDSGIRVTINGVSSIATAKYMNSSGTWTVTGNLYLWDEDELVDNGLDWNLSTVAGLLPTLPASLVTLCLRNPGTYQVKIERALFEPVAYLYNEVRLPKLPEWDVTKYPYALMLDDDENPSKLAYLYLSTVPFTVNVGYIYNYIYATADGSAIAYIINTSMGVTDDDWVRREDRDATFVQGETVYTVSTYFGMTPKWANYSVAKYDDGSEYLAASDPIPVYE